MGGWGKETDSCGDLPSGLSYYLCMATNRSVGSFASSTKSAAGSDIEGSLEAGQKASILNEFRAGEFMSSPANDDMQ